MVNKEKDKTTEEKILVAAKQVFVTKGMAGARMQDIADAAGINKALLHYYFRSKEKLFEVIFKEVAGQILPQINAIIEAEIPLFEKIEKFCAVYIDKILENPFLPIFLLSEATRQPELFLQQTFSGQKIKVELFLEQINREVEKGLINPIEPLQLFLNMISMCLFPIISKPILQFVTGISEDQFRQLMETRKKEVPQFIINAIRK
jgi:TetR/AcrR family transcriptional regulator